MKRFEEPAIVIGLASTARKIRPKYRELIRPILLVIRVDMAAGLQINRRPKNRN
jgi:hypothetical protein